MLRVRILPLFYLILIKVGTGQNYISPVKHAITLAGTFGEIRASHFHAGIDIRPSAAPVDTIYAIADGKLSRVKTQRAGFGRAIYIDHPDGHTSVYAHLSHLLEPIQSIVYKAQMEAESYEVDLSLSDQDLHIRKGQAIGWMGNAGNSYGKHLHFEIRETQSEIPVNPFLFGIKAADKTRPTIAACSVAGLNPDLNPIHRLSIGKGFSTQENATTPTYAIPAWRAGLSVYAFDQLQGAPNKNGYYEMKMFVDDSLYYHSMANAVSYDEGGLIDAWVDYGISRKTGRREAMLYKTPSNQISMLKYIKGDGSIALYAATKRKICIEVSDFDGNTTKAYLNLVRDTLMKSNIAIPTCEYLLETNESRLLEKDKVRFEVPEYLTPTATGMSVFADSMGFSFGCVETALLKPVAVCLPVPASLLGNPRMILAKTDEKVVSSRGGEVRDGLFCTTIGSTGKYRFMIDDKPPVITPIQFSTAAGKRTQFTFELKDNVRYSGQAKTFEYKVFIDNKYIPCEMKELVKTLYIPLKDLKPGNHELKIYARDFVGNETSFERQFVK